MIDETGEDNEYFDDYYQKGFICPILILICIQNLKGTTLYLQIQRRKFLYHQTGA